MYCVNGTNARKVKEKDNMYNLEHVTFFNPRPKINRGVDHFYIHTG